MPFSNSERDSFGCLRLWSLSYVQNYRTEDRAEALTYGTIWHTILEKVLLEVKENDTWMTEERLTEILNDDLLPIIENEYLSSGDAQALEEAMSFGKIDEIQERIINAIPGWLISWKEVFSKFKILEVEVPLAAPVVDVDGNIAKFSVPIIKEGDVYRPARIGESGEYAKIPYYKIGKVDCLLEDRVTGDLWICDHKTTGSPSSFENSIPFDVQLPSYASLLDWEINYGELQKYKGKRITGVMYDICHSKISSIPNLLKSGKLSMAKNAGITSWIFEQAIELYGLGRSQYRSHLEFLRNNVDNKKFFQRYYYISETDIDRCASEDFGIANAMNHKRNSLNRLKKDDKDGFDAEAYRYPICKKYGNCKFSSICLADNHPSVIMVENDTPILWCDNPKTQ